MISLYHTLIISNGRSVILDNKKKSDHVQLYLEDMASKIELPRVSRDWKKHT